MEYDDLTGLAYIKTRFNNSATSDEIDLKAGALCNIDLPAGLQGTTLSIKAAFQRNGTKVFKDVYDDWGNKIVIPIGNTARIISTKRLLPLGLSTIKLVSSAVENTTSVAVCTQEVYAR